MLQEESQIYRNYFSLSKFPYNDVPEKTWEAQLELLARHYKNFLLDGWGTLYVGDQLMPGAKEMLEYLREKDRTIRLVTNSASVSPERLQEKLEGMGLLFHPSEIVSSGSLLPMLNEKLQLKEALYLGRAGGLGYLEQAGIDPVDDPVKPVVILSSAHTEEDERALAEDVLSRKDSLLIVLNPDIAAPMGIDTPDSQAERRFVSGYHGWKMHQKTGCKIIFCGKPFPLIFHNAIEKLIPSMGGVIMIGDTLGTDIAGAVAAGIDSALLLQGNTPADQFNHISESLDVRPNYSFPADFPASGIE